MKKLRSISLKQLSLMIFLLVFFAGSTLFLFGYKRDEKMFHKITSGLFFGEMTQNTLNMHYTLAYPENFGIEAYTPTFHLYEKEQSLDSSHSTRKLIEALDRIRADKLSEKDRYAYTLLLRTLKNNLALAAYPYYSEPLSPASGTQSQLPVLLAEYDFRKPEDVEDYLSLLKQIPEYFDSLLTYEQEKKEAGLFMAASSAEKVIAQCENIITGSELSAKTHFLQTSFSEKIAALVSSGIINQEQAASFTARNDTILSDLVLPAYLSLAEGIRTLRDDQISISGVSAKPNGAAYYQLYLSSVTGSGRNVPEIREMLLEAFNSEWMTINKLSEKYPETAALFGAGETPLFPLNDENAILEDLLSRISSGFPPLSGIDVTVKEVSDSLEKYSAPAFYLTPPIDDYTQNVIYINRLLCSDPLELYTTLAHEGYPGHLYQTVYFDQYRDAADDNIIRSILWYGGYLEGWAIYSEFFAFDQASRLLYSPDDPEPAAYIQLEKHNRSLQLCLYSLLDIMINYENASVSQVADILSGFGITSVSSVNAIYSYIAEEPCNYLKYYLGYLELLCLKDKAKEIWGDSYTDLRFHQFYLESGPSDFVTLTEKLLSEGS